MMFDFERIKLSKNVSKRIRKTLHGFVTLLTSGSIVLSSVAGSYAQTIIVDPSAPGTSFLQTSNGTPQINIATPQSGVSLNKFTTFNVGPNGLILNNSTSNGVSVIGQNVTANQNLMVSGPANVIVNDVTSAAPSSLTGITEVFGQRAAVIIANPNGINCNGCAFLNSSSSTLTTGTPVVSGARVDLHVTKGTVTIGPNGFAAGQQAGIFGRHVVINGPVVTDGQAITNSLVVSGGAQRVNDLDFERLYRSSIVSAPSTVAKTSPFAIDASEAGTLTGGQTRIRGMESGQGVNLYGDVDVRSLYANSRGNLFYRNMDIEFHAAIVGQGIRQYGDLNVKDAMASGEWGWAKINGRSFTLYDGRTIETAGDIEINAADFAIIAGEVSGQNITVDVSTGSLTNTGFLMADGDLTIVAGENVTQQRGIAREYDIYFDPALQQYLQAYYAQLVAGGAEADIAAKMIARASQHEIIEEYIDRGATSTATNVTITATDGDITNTGGAIAGTNDVRLTAGASIINDFLALRSRLDAEDGCSGENCGYRTDFHAGEILAGNDLSLTAGLNIENLASDMAAANNLTLTAGQDVVNSLTHSNYEASENVAILLTGPTLTWVSCGKECTSTSVVSKAKYTANDYVFDEENILSPGRIVTLYGDIDVNAGRDFVSVGSLVSAGNDLNITAVGQAILTSYVDAEVNFVDETRRELGQNCTTGDKGSTYCSTAILTTTTREDGTVLATATSDLIGRNISISTGEDLTVLGARLFASGDLELNSTNGSVLIDSTDLPNAVSRNYNGAAQLVELSDDLVAQIFGPPATRLNFTSSDLGRGLSGRDSATGSGYILYVDGSVGARFTDVHSHTSDRFIVVSYDVVQDQWYYDNNTELVAFTPRSDDRLVARVDFSADTVEHLDGIDAFIGGVAAGYRKSDLNITANHWNGSANAGEFSVSLSYLEFGSAQADKVTENTANYISFLQENDLLTAVEALRRADSGADIKEAARAVGVQSYVSLIDSSRLSTLQEEANAAVDAVHSTIGAQIAAHDISVSEYNAGFRAELAELEDHLNLTDSERTAEINVALQTVTAEFNADVATVETAYNQALAANQAKYGHRLTKRVLRTRYVSSGKSGYYQNYYVTVPDPYYINLKNNADALALSDRASDLNAAESVRLINVALVTSSFTDAAINQQISELAGVFNARINGFATEKTQLLTSLNTLVSDAMRRAELVIQQEALDDSMRGEAIARGTVVEGENSLAAALTNDAFPELELIQDVATNAQGIVENSRDGDEARIRLVTRTRDVGEFQEQTKVVRQTRYTYTCSSSGKEQYCYNAPYYVDVEVPETNWVITGTEEYQAEETYLDGVASQNTLISSNKDEQDAFIAATAWRFAGHEALQSQSPRNRLVSQADLSVTAQSGTYLGQGRFEAFGQLNVTSLGGVIAKSAELSGSQIAITAGGDVTGYGVALAATNDISIFSAGAVDIGALGRTYNNGTGFKNIIGTLAGKTWANQRAGTGAGARVMVSQELSSIASGNELTINALDDLTLSGVTANVAGDVTLTTNADLTLSAPRSVIEYHAGDDRNGTDLWDIRSHVTDITTGGDFTATAGGAALLEGTRITAAGALDLATLNDLTLSAAQNIYEYSHRTYSSGLLTKKSSSHSITRLIHDGADLTAGSTLGLESQEGNLITAGSRFESLGGDINLSATLGDVLAGVYTDIDRNHSQYSSSSFFGLISSSGNSLVDHRNATGTSALADIDLTIVSGGDTELVGAQLSAGRDLNLNVGGDLRVLAAIQSQREEFFESKMGAIIATTKTERLSKDTAVLTTLSANGDISFSVGGKTYITLYNYEDEDAPNAAELYPDELLALSNLVLLNEELLDEYFYDETKSLSPAFMAVLSIALTAGFSSMLTGPLSQTAVSSGLATSATAGTGAAAATTITITRAGQAVAAFAASSTIGSLNGAVSGEFDLGEILKNAALSAGTQFLQSAINLKISGNLEGEALARATASNLQEAATSLKTIPLLGGAWDKSFTTSIFAGGSLTIASVLEGAFDATLSSGINSAVNGTSFRKGLSSSLISSVVALGLADVQNGIGAKFAKGANGGEGSIGHVLLHGLAGCAAAEVQGADCASGAANGISAAIYSGLQETPEQSKFLSDEAFQEAYAAWRTDVMDGARYVALATSFLFSGGEADNVSVGYNIIESAVANNYLNHKQQDIVEERLLEWVACREAPGNCTEERKNEILTELAQLKSISGEQQRKMLLVCSRGESEACQKHIDAAEGFAEWALFSTFNSGQTALGALASFSPDDYFSMGTSSGLSGGADTTIENSINLDRLTLAYAQKIQSGVTPEEAGAELAVSMQRADGSLKIVGGVLEVAGIAACRITKITCLLGFLNAGIGVDKIYEGTVTVITGEDKLSAIEAGLVTTGRYSEQEASELRDDISAGVAILTLGAGGVYTIYKGGRVLVSFKRTSHIVPNRGFAGTRTEFDNAFPSSGFPSQAHADDAWAAYRSTSTDARPIAMGRQNATEVADSLGFQRLNVQNWSPEVNDAWVRGGIDARRDFSVLSEPNIANYRAEGRFGPSGEFLGRGPHPDTVFFREMRQLRDAGYRLDGFTMRPPSN